MLTVGNIRGLNSIPWTEGPHYSSKHLMVLLLEWLQLIYYIVGNTSPCTADPRGTRNIKFTLEEHVLSNVV
jgi:hypothetical protein